MCVWERVRKRERMGPQSRSRFGRNTIWEITLHHNLIAVPCSVVWLFVTPWTAVSQASLSFTISWSLLTLMSIESMMPSNHLILRHPLPLPPWIFPSIRVFSSQLTLHIRWSFSFSINPSSEYSGFILFSCYVSLIFEGTFNTVSENSHVHKCPLATWCEELTHWKRPWCWERLKAEGEGDNRGWDGWMASPTWWTWVWASLGTGDAQGSLTSCSPGGCKESDMTERLNWIELNKCPWVR